MGLTITAFCVTLAVIIFMLVEASDPEVPKIYTPKRLRYPKRQWARQVYQVLDSLTDGLTKMIMSIPVRRRYQQKIPRTCTKRAKQKRHCYPSHYQVTSMTSTWSRHWSAPSTRVKQFDSDSHVLMLDDGASACITNCEEDFIKPPKRVDQKVKGIKGHANANRGTLKWYLEDDTGLVYVMIIQGAYLIPDASPPILSPQHLAQQADDHYPKEEGTGSMTTSKNITLFWSQRQFVKTVPFDPRTNVGLTTTAAGT